MEELQNYIGGQWTDTAFDRRSDLIDPSTGEAFANAPVSSETEVAAAFSSAAEAFPGWRDSTPAERSLALLRIADAIESHADELVKAESQNTGKPIALTLSEEIPPMVDQIRFFAGAARNLEGLAAAEYMAGHTSFVRREPLGVCGAVTPWNYPMMMAVWKFAPALADYSAALAVNPHFASSLYGRGLTKQKMGDDAGGKIDITAAQGVDPMIAQHFGK